MLYVPIAGGQWQQVIYGPAAARPAAAYGTVITPAQNSKGSYAQLLAGASLTSDVYGVIVNFNSGAVSTAARDIIADIGIDPAGGTTYTVLLPDLGASAASKLCDAARPASGHNYYFPIFIPAGTSIGCRGSVNNATVGTFRASVSLLCRPRRPDAIRVGRRVEAIGIAAASSAGTAVTTGTTSDGTWTSLGTSVNKNWWWQSAFFDNVGEHISDAYFMDLSAGAVGGDKLLIMDQLIDVNGNNDDITHYAGGVFLDGEVAAGSTIYGRLQCTGTGDATLSMAAYGLS